MSLAIRRARRARGRLFGLSGRVLIVLLIAVLIAFCAYTWSLP